MLDSETINGKGRKSTLWYQQKYKLSEKSNCSEINVNIIDNRENNQKMQFTEWEIFTSYILDRINS